jgi:hypothetical protein
MTVPILFLVFNRPDLVEQSFARIRDARPAQLFIAADGPRPDREGEAELCSQCREIVDCIDWDCEVKTLFRDSNLGCRIAVSEAITWFFEHVEEGIVLEDDCVAEPSFFRFCSELLELYRYDNRIMCITGNNFQNGIIRGAASYYFSIYNHCWGWATWRRAWQLYDCEMKRWTELKSSDFLSGFLQQRVAEYWTREFDSILSGCSHVWDYQWELTCWSNSGLTATPNVNLVSNIGFDDRATHTKDANSAANRLQSYRMNFPLRHPADVSRYVIADRFVEQNHFGIGPALQRPSVIKRLSRKLFLRRFHE